MQKPVSALIAELKKKIHEAAVESALPPCILEPVFSSYTAQLSILAMQEAQRDMAAENEEDKKEEQ